MKDDIQFIKLEKEFKVLDDGRKFLDEFQIVNTLGEGTFGKVLLAIHHPTQEKVAIKILKKDSIQYKRDSNKIYLEIKIQSLLHHKNIPRIYQVIETNKTICLILEYCPGLDLISYLRQKGKLNEESGRSIFIQLIDILDYLSKFKIAHRDIKLDNIIINEEGTIKLVDFGLSNFYNNILQTACGSPSYVAPEIINNEFYNPLKSDIWSCGIVLYSLIAGKLPFEGENENELYKKIISGKYITPKHFSLELKDLLFRIFYIDPNLRITIDEIKNHKWLNFYSENFYNGILLGMIPPIDYDIVCFMLQNYKDLFNILDVVSSIIYSKKNRITTYYDLLIKRKIKGKFIFNVEKDSKLFQFKSRESICDFNSELYKKYYHHHLKMKNKNIDKEEIIKSHIFLIEKLNKFKTNPNLEINETISEIKETEVKISENLNNGENIQKNLYNSLKKEISLSILNEINSQRENKKYVNIKRDVKENKIKGYIGRNSFVNKNSLNNFKNKTTFTSCSSYKSTSTKETICSSNKKNSYINSYKDKYLLTSLKKCNSIIK